MEQTLQKTAEEYAHELCCNSSKIEECEIREAFIDGAKWQKKQSPWINAKETLPKVGEAVLWFSVDYSEGGFIGELEEDEQQINIYDDTEDGLSAKIKDHRDLWWIPIPNLNEKDCGSKEL